MGYNLKIGEISPVQILYYLAISGIKIRNEIRMKKILCSILNSSHIQAKREMRVYMKCVDGSVWA